MSKNRSLAILTALVALMSASGAFAQEENAAVEPAAVEAVVPETKADNATVNRNVKKTKKHERFMEIVGESFIVDVFIVADGFSFVESCVCERKNAEIGV